MPKFFSYRNPRLSTLRKQDYAAAASAAGFDPRPSWLHPTTAELYSHLKLFCQKNGYKITKSQSYDSSFSRNSRWNIFHPNSDKVVLSWDSVEGELTGRFVGGHWREFVEALPEIEKNARDTMSVHMNNGRYQVIMCLMDNIPVAPFFKQGQPYYHLARASDEDCIRTFYSTLTKTIHDSLILEASADVALKRIEISSQKAVKVYEQTPGHVETCIRSHEELAQYARGV